MLCRGTFLLPVLTATVCLTSGDSGEVSVVCWIMVLCKWVALVYLCSSERIGNRDRKRYLCPIKVCAYLLQQTSCFFHVCMGVCLAVCMYVCECMISSGDRILRACSNWRANANAWLVVLHRLVLKSEVARSAGFGPGTKTDFWLPWILLASSL